MRSEFEKAFPVPAHWIEFDGKSNKYYCPFVADATASEYQSKWVVWQHQQAKVDELNQELHLVLNNWNDLTRAIHARTNGTAVAEARQLHEKVGELQKRLDELEKTQNRFEPKAEESECVSMCLDDHGVAKCDPHGKSYSLWGRVCQFKKTVNFTEDDLERIYWEFDSERTKQGEERLRFKEALRGLLDQAIKGGGE